MKSDLENLLALQETDKAVQVVEKELKALEPETAALDAELGRATAELEAATQALADARKWRQELENKIETYRVMQERKRQKLEWVRGAKEASTIMAELDLARTVLAKEEAEWLRSAERLEDAEAAVETARTALEEAREQQVPQRAALAARRTEIEGRIAIAAAARAEARKLVTRPLLQRYDRILRGNATVAVYALHESACGRCFTAVPMHLRQQVMRDGSIITCEGCGVMLYYIAA